MMPSDSGSRRAASGGALERRKMARASTSRTAATMRSVLRVRRLMEMVIGPSGMSVASPGRGEVTRGEFGPAATGLFCGRLGIDAEVGKHAWRAEFPA